MPPSAREGGFELAAAYAVEAELVRAAPRGRPQRRSASRWATRTRRCGARSSSRRSSGRTCTTTRCATPSGERGALSIGRMIAPKIEPEIVFELKAPIDGGARRAAAVLEARRVARARVRDHRLRLRRLEVSAGRLRGRLRAARRARRRRAAAGRRRHRRLVEALPAFTVSLSKDGAVAAEGSRHGTRSAVRRCAWPSWPRPRSPAAVPAAGGGRPRQLRHAHRVAADRARASAGAPGASRPGRRPAALAIDG